MKKTILVLVLLVMGLSTGQAQILITKWTFSSTVAAPDNSPAPTTGTGTAKSLGMTNVYTYAGTTATNSVTSDDVTSVSGSFTEDTWRIRGKYQSTGTAPNNGAVTNSANVNGWNLSAPQYSQGAEFDVSTVGYANIHFSFDWFSTNQGVKDMQEQYTLDGTTWSNINSLLVAVPGNFYTTSSPTNTIDLSGISGAANDANFGIRLVSAYDPTTGGTTYSGASGGTYNNSSGNWSFANMAVTGTAVPEPSAWALMLAGLVFLLGFQVRRRRA